MHFQPRQKMNNLDLSFVNAVPIVLTSHDELEIILCGCGGSGSWLAPSIARLVRIIQESSRKISTYFVDFDIIENANIPRQNFSDAELGLNKAQVLALRYGLAWGVEIVAIPERFDPDMVQRKYRKLTVVIGCVDNAAARGAIAQCLEYRYDDHQGPKVWWLDAGNSENGGQVLLGSAVNPLQMKVAFSRVDGVGLSLCAALPAPSIQHPELLVARPEELENNNLSCEQLALVNAQSLMVNQRVASEVADYLLRLLVTKNLKRFATYFDLSSGSSRSKYVVPEVIALF